MEIEYEIKFLNIAPDAMREKLSNIWAQCTIPLRRMQRYVFAHPTNKNAYIRIRQEWNKITTSYKVHNDNNAIDSVKEIEVTIDNVEWLRKIYHECWLREKAIQETYRETRTYQNNTITIDRWPGLLPFIEIEWNSEKDVEEMILLLGYNKDHWILGTVSDIYFKELWIPHDTINNTPIITFDNPPQPWKW